MTQKSEWDEDDRFNVAHKLLCLTKWKSEGSQAIKSS